MTLPIREFQGQYRFLSNFWPARITVDDVDYPSVEHAFQAMKYYDHNRRFIISRLSTPGEAKRYGRSGPLRAGWDAMKVNAMLGLLYQKFSVPVLRAKLLDTGEAELIEGNTWGDTFWGVCKGVGENTLGKLLMEVREEIRKEQEVPK